MNLLNESHFLRTPSWMQRLVLIGQSVKWCTVCWTVRVQEGVRVVLFTFMTKWLGQLPLSQVYVVWSVKLTAYISPVLSVPCVHGMDFRHESNFALYFQLTENMLWKSQLFECMVVLFAIHLYTQVMSVCICHQLAALAQHTKLYG